jgi:L-ascorbate metabolism protein UlaG (beta-lactamase superfamily)
MALKSRYYFLALFLFYFSMTSVSFGAEIGKKVQLTWLGQSGFKIVSPSGKVILIDPWVKGNNLYPFKSPSGEPDLTPLLDADLILITHGHLDHLGDTIPIANDPGSKKELKIVSIFEIMTYLWQEGIDQKKLVPMNIGGTVKVEDLQVTMVRAVHSSGIGPFSPKSLTYGGEAAGFIIEMNNGFKIYHTGDTALFGEMKTYNTFYHPNLMLVPIGGVFTMGPKEAAMAAELVHPQYIIPMHYGGTFNLPGTPAEFKSALSKRGKGIKLIIPTPGKPIN